jgi:hypothetical protein
MQPYATSHVRDVCEGAVLACQKGAGGQAYFLTDTEKTTFREFITGLLATQGITPGSLSLPWPAAWASAAFLEGLWWLFHLRGRPPITRTLLALIGVPIELSDAKARTELVYTGYVSRPAFRNCVTPSFIQAKPYAEPLLDSPVQTNMTAPQRSFHAIDVPAISREINISLINT